MPTLCYMILLHEHDATMGPNQQEKFEKGGRFGMVRVSEVPLTLQEALFSPCVEFGVKFCF